jgi:hypothetical protein
VQDRFAFLVIEFDRLLLVEFVEIGIVPVNKDAALGDMRFEAGRGIAKGARTSLDDVLERLLGARDEILRSRGRIDVEAIPAPLRRAAQINAGDRQPDFGRRSTAAVA